MTNSPHGEPASVPAARFRVVLLIVLVVVLLGALGTNVWLLASRALPGRDSAAVGVQRERDAVMSQARQFTLRSLTYGPDELDADGKLSQNRAQVAEVVSDKFDAAYEQSIGAIEQVVKAEKVGQTAKVLGIGVQTLDDDSARALVTGESTFTRQDAEGIPQTVQSKTFRTVVDLVKVDGTWLVDASNVYVDESAAGTPTPSGTPTGSPSGSPAGEGTP